MNVWASLINIYVTGQIWVKNNLKMYSLIISLIKCVCIGTGREQKISSFLAQVECLIYIEK